MPENNNDNLQELNDSKFIEAFDAKNGKLQACLKWSTIINEKFLDILNSIDKDCQGLINLRKLSNCEIINKIDDNKENSLRFFGFYKELIWPILQLLIDQDDPNLLSFFFDLLALDDTLYWRNNVVKSLLLYCSKNSKTNCLNLIYHRCKIESEMLDGNLYKALAYSIKNELKFDGLDRLQINNNPNFIIEFLKSCIKVNIGAEKFRKLFFEYKKMQTNSKFNEENLELLMIESIKCNNNKIFHLLSKFKQQRINISIDIELYKNLFKHFPTNIGRYLFREPSNNLIQLIQFDHNANNSEFVNELIYLFSKSNRVSILDGILKIKNFDLSFVTKFTKSITNSTLQLTLCHPLKLLKFFYNIMKFLSYYKVSTKELVDHFIHVHLANGLEGEYERIILLASLSTFIEHGALFDYAVVRTLDIEISNLIWLCFNNKKKVDVHWLRSNDLPLVRPLTTLCACVIRQCIPNAFQSNVEKLFDSYGHLENLVTMKPHTHQYIARGLAIIKEHELLHNDETYPVVEPNEDIVEFEGALIPNHIYKDYSTSQIHFTAKDLIEKSSEYCIQSFLADILLHMPEEDSNDEVEEGQEEVEMEEEALSEEEEIIEVESDDD